VHAAAAIRWAPPLPLADGAVGPCTNGLQVALGLGRDSSCCGDGLGDWVLGAALQPWAVAWSRRLGMNRGASGWVFSSRDGHRCPLDRSRDSARVFLLISALETRYESIDNPSSPTLYREINRFDEQPATMKIPAALLTLALAGAAVAQDQPELPSCAVRHPFR
jgi:hypothetical protein